MESQEKEAVKSFDAYVKKPDVAKEPLPNKQMATFNLKGNAKFAIFTFFNLYCLIMIVTKI